MYVKTIYHSPLGPMSLVTSDRGLRGAWFEDQKFFERGLNEKAILAPHPILNQTRLLLDAYFSGEEVDFTSLPLEAIGTEFQEKVWALLKEIPHGQTTSYGQLAQQLGVCSGQAVGGAVGRNPYSIIVPCHRVLNQKGQLTGYAGGLDKKIWLLQHENPQFEVKK
ncbi:methylated-DNA--[protein]-cysteine S-methyltransferase [Streptococcus suis]|uniref:methylated-DNA--[protein]-cysteine S-methyltransferase n=1 Tax=Streptococcus suis TaxID=1307 RepID=UPI00211C9CD7|nr:methylated-DNA--[protein]-cysteine S-methyltransferase [Streptococcus suis]MCQ9225474.1 methylated-DNA--[protein]-cysteine S-methyltransferase [Streptococcus suis]MCQ9227748.1 methylated-DNA--[protein]-cysteine S-methyltransferase [Streptococcus suis]MCQ9241936.1 methylated-DNA--[protein]-cysteine S-methyltransferase [Streptococcus suis]MCQ9274040.1 methylated-DNA--[protein]-cysteine S-methyltransferase [Streptococcus suis]MDE7535256.1 methylated-DNA--[protein]-cysteine S-methyltransferase 